MGSTILLNLISQLAKQQILIIGDMMLDSYLKGSANRICREAPVPIVNIDTWVHSPGGAANTAINAAKLGANTWFSTVAGDDAEGERILALLQKQGVHTQAIVTQDDRRTLAKQRIVASGQLLVRFDYGSEEYINSKAETTLMEFLEKKYQEFDVIVLSDYGYGVITPAILEKVKQLQRIYQKVLVVDAKDLRLFKELQPTAVKPNYMEACMLLQLQAEKGEKRVDQILAKGNDILTVTGAKTAAITIDTEGAVIFEKGKKPYRTYTKPQANSKAAGAGDTFVATLALALATGASPLYAAEIAAAAAAVVVQKEDTATCSLEEIREYFRPEQKLILSRDELQRRCQAYHEQGRTIVFTNGCFDIIHRGHIGYLAEAKEKGDILIIGVNSDESIKRLKGQERPINTLQDRLEVLSAMEMVDHLIAFDEDTPENIIRFICPNVFVKGGDYTRETLPEAPLVESLGGKVEIISYLPKHSTTHIINRIRAHQ